MSTITNSYNSNSASYLIRSPLTPNMSDIRSEPAFSPSPKFTTQDHLKPNAMRDSQLMTPPFSPAKVGDALLQRSGDDSLAFYLSKNSAPIDGPLFPDELIPTTATETTSLPIVRKKFVDVVQGRGIKRKLLDYTEESETKRSMRPGEGKGEWFIMKFTPPQDVKRYLEGQKALIGRMKPLKPRPIVIPIEVIPSIPAKRSHKRGASGNVKRGRPITTRSPRSRVPVDFQTSTRAASSTPLVQDGAMEIRPIKVARRPAPKVVDPNAPPKVSKGQRTDAEFEEALAIIATPIYYPPTDNLDRLGPNAMKVEWKSSKKSYSPAEFTRFQNLKDVKFHPKEVDLAGTINMVHFAQYEESKRLIFRYWYERKSHGQTFTKTHAQQAAHVDVNKASALWTAFDKVNWFSDEAFKLVSSNKKSWF